MAQTSQSGVPLDAIIHYENIGVSFSGTTAQTFTHLLGFTPSFVLAIPRDGAKPVAVSAIGATTFVVTPTNGGTVDILAF